MSLAGDANGNPGPSGYYSGTPLGAATADPYGQNHYYVPGYALSPGLRAYQNGVGIPVYGQSYAPSVPLRNRDPIDSRVDPNASKNSDDAGDDEPGR
jgi:hypothetical protein